MAAEAILKVAHLRTYFFSRYKLPLKAVDGVSYEIRQGETVAVAGESGCGKSMSVLSLVRLNPPSSTIVGGEVCPFSGGTSPEVATTVASVGP